MPPYSLSDAARALRALRRTWPITPAITRAGAINIQIARAVGRGDRAGADALRWLHYPDKMRARQLAREAGLPPPK